MVKKKTQVKKQKPVEQVAYEIRVAYDSHCIDSYQSDEPYGEWRQHDQVSVGDTFTFTPTTNSNGKSYDILVPFEPQPDRPYYLIYGIYSSGDSFGSSSGNLHFVGLFEHQEDAVAIAKLLEGASKDFSIKYKEQTYYIPWNGYFESLERLEMCPIRLGDSGKKTFYSSGRWDYER